MNGAEGSANPMIGTTTETRETRRDRPEVKPPLAKDQLYKVLVALASVTEGDPNGYLTAREIAAAATARSLPILAENVRKVLRTRAVGYVESRSRGEGVNRVTEFRLNTAGRDFFHATYPFA